jgi:hypothetical protein
VSAIGGEQRGDSGRKRERERRESGEGGRRSEKRERSRTLADSVDKDELDEVHRIGEGREWGVKPDKQMRAGGSEIRGIARVDIVLVFKSGDGGGLRNEGWGGVGGGEGVRANQADLAFLAIFFLPIR